MAKGKPTKPVNVVAIALRDLPQRKTKTKREKVRAIERKHKRKAYNADS